MMKDIIQMQIAHKNRVGNMRSVEDELDAGLYDDFENTPAYQVVTINGEYDIGIHFIVKSRQFGEAEIYVITKPDDQLQVGDYVTDKNGDTWICYTRDKFNIHKHFMELCNATLRWQDENTIYEIPCALSDKTSVYSDGMYRNQNMVLADDQILVTIPYNDITKRIPYNKRFIFDYNENEVYKTFRKDTLPRPGLMDIKMRRARFDKDRDSAEHGLADYYKEYVPNEKVDIFIEGFDWIISGVEEEYFVENKSADVYFEVDNAGVELTNLDNNRCTLIVNKKINEFTLYAKDKTTDEIQDTMVVSVSYY